MKKSDFNLQRLAKNNFLIWKKKKEEEEEEKKKRHEFRTIIENETTLKKKICDLYEKKRWMPSKTAT